MNYSTHKSCCPNLLVVEPGKNPVNRGLYNERLDISPLGNRSTKVNYNGRETWMFWTDTDRYQRGPLNLTGTILLTDRLAECYGEFNAPVYGTVSLFDTSRRR